jgi:WhiB family transcriptional regulator, redox-sensing transcriptional regulator
VPNHKPATEADAPLSPQLLAEARSDTARTWASQALCVGANPESFFPPGDGPAIEARRICAMCPVRGQCLAYAVTADEPSGIWGGLDARERHSLRRQIQRREPSAGSRTGSAA